MQGFIGFKRKVYSSATSTDEFFKHCFLQREPEGIEGLTRQEDGCVSSDSEDNDQGM
jgi:hypothetical protein|tara:strand:- start:507 stop:677 length:171 start_codon:yes stop_codon:yes gene_type:complete